MTAEEVVKWKVCGKVAQVFIAREGSFFPCALEEGHEGPCIQSGNCFRHGVYYGRNCPHWPTCVRDAASRIQRDPVEQEGE